MTASSVWDSGVRALKPASAHWAIFPAIRAVAAAGAVAVVGAATGHLDAIGVAYFGAACAVVFITNGAYRTRLTMLGAQAGGAVAGIILGVVSPHDPAVLIVTATAVGMLAGVLGALGPAATAAALMAVIGLSFGQFAGLPLAWWQQGAWYFAVLSAPKLYALSVIGITASALLSASIGNADPVFPLVRLLDTLLGCAIAIVFGYLLWRRNAVNR